MAKKYHIAIVSYETMPNPITEGLRTYLRAKYPVSLTYITHPMLETKDSYGLSSKYKIFSSKKLVRKKVAYHWKLPMALSYLKDFLYTFYWSFTLNKKWDAYFGVGNLNPLPGIILKWLGRVDKVVYQCMDYYPTRFANPIMNWLYFQLDRFCVRFSDETWNVSPMMQLAREKKMNMKGRGYDRQFTVPGGIWFDRVKRKPFSKIDKHKLIYRGYLLNHMGVDLPVSAMPYILKKVKNARLEILGGGPDEEKLKKLVKKLKLERSVIFHGWVTDRQKLEDALSTAAIGMATFNTKILDEKVKNADPGKIKDYMLLGMPVVTTNAVWYHQKIAKTQSGFVVKYNPKDLADVVIKFLKDEEKQKLYRKNALAFIKDFDWNVILDKNIPRVLS